MFSPSPLLLRCAGTLFVREKLLLKRVGFGMGTAIVIAEYCSQNVLEE
jgi:hypothetical protein